MKGEIGLSGSSIGRILDVLGCKLGPPMNKIEKPKNGRPFKVMGVEMEGGTKIVKAEMQAGTKIVKGVEMWVRPTLVVLPNPEPVARPAEVPGELPGHLVRRLGLERFEREGQASEDSQSVSTGNQDAEASGTNSPST
jgi:hypothetical protein